MTNAAFLIPPASRQAWGAVLAMSLAAAQAWLIVARSSTKIGKIITTKATFSTVAFPSLSWSGPQTSAAANDVDTSFLPFIRDTHGAFFLPR